MFRSSAFVAALACLSCTGPSPYHSLGFHGLDAGPLLELRSDQGLWRSAVGHAEIDALHGASSKPCLRLLGGDARQIELTLSGGPQPVHALVFRAERWTSREPFDLRVEVSGTDGWRELSDVSHDIAVGGFHTRVRLVIDESIERVRLTSTTPEGSGLLIDDWQLIAPAPMRLMSVRTTRPAMPVLPGVPVNPVARVELVVTGNLRPLVVRSIRVDLTGSTNLDDIERVELLYDEQVGSAVPVPPHPDTLDERRFGAALSPSGDELVFTGWRELSAGKQGFWVSVVAASDADIDGRVVAGCTGLTVVGGDDADDRVRADDLDGSGTAWEVLPEVVRPSEGQRLGVALRRAGDDAVAVHRIPGLVTTNAGTLVAVYDLRWNGWGDLPGDVDVGLSRSTDGGRSWEPMRVIMDMGQDADFAGDGVGDPAILVDRQTGTLFVAAVWSHGDRAWRGSGPGLSPDETGQLMLVRSDDDGLTWSAPRNLTGQIKRPEWSYLLQGPGRGISCADGTLVFPAQFQLAPDQDRKPHATLMFSRDHGETWQIGVGMAADTTESAVVELDDGTWMLNARDNRGGARSVFTTTDRGASWHEHGSSRRLLIEPVCMASLIHVGRELDGHTDGRLLFSNPDVASPPRRNMTIKASRDSGRHWPVELRLLLDAGTSAGYSCLTLIDEHTVGILYEGSRAQLTFQRIPLVDLFGE
jgi:sialidase-1